jgi:hypothetical protein
MLESLRNGHVDVPLGVLEARLDNDLVTLGAMRREHLPESAPKAIGRAAEYRAKYPHASSSPVVEEAIQRAFSRANQ